MLLPFVVAIAAMSSSLFHDLSPTLIGWKVKGAVSGTKVGAKFGEKDGTIIQRYEVPGLRILYFGAHAKLTNPKTVITARVECFDRHGKPLMDQSGNVDPKKGSSPEGDEGAVYLKTQAQTTYVNLIVEKHGPGTAVVDSLKFEDNDHDRVEHAPEVDLAEYMKPLWAASRITDESVLLKPDGRLLFQPDRILSVKDSTRSFQYRDGIDYKLDGRTITAIDGSKVSTLLPRQFATGQFPWTDLAGKHVFVTYTHTDLWTGPVPTCQESSLPRFTGRLKSKENLTIVAYGDSITLGINVSGYRNVPPYMPPWPTLVADQLSALSGNRKIQLINMGLGGMTSEWAKDNAKDAVGVLKPDLVLIGFGMNDFWSLNPEQFRKNIESTIATIRQSSPHTEFLLIATMKFDPAYTNDPTYVGNLAGYAKELASLKGPGIAVFDMTELSQALYDRKDQKDLGTDPMHPDDFLARWYAQGVVATLTSLTDHPKPTAP